MSSKKKKKAALYEKLRAATNSNAMNKTSIIVDASKYIGELKKKVDRLNHEIGTSSTPQNSLSAVRVTVETLEKGFLINVFSGKNCPGLLVSILEAFDELGLDVLDARVSCEDNFLLEAIGGDQNQGHDAQVVKQAVLQAIHNWNGGR
ncbi:transcription factor SCREAM2 isoform X2 [Populus alba x Populus x berolinensis]|uniref:Transcription factor SCREAM2 isoform X2 n=1 Tax=Populus alba x Populus x berolinensis TaxID=444605 RepID=A0AAD6QMK2_9ROSI|nr:transcription factor SCREAM2 isoform X2 [Populus trichocarpa]XP_034913607.1 transcription factor SCREAM2-like isoform X1 [Populus alba]KAJ6913371.1 transcription factor SCREAM2 isoform X2 [Populus alba x Populus x berolinensis]KAJ6993104.1 transcription factor SCREAM2 isoform X2 [Populus alba x Populus x berolinensis]|eukprot:XP_024459246.1 transcription factor SCREAM2 isoform X2 [Populus trichocarpa]